MRIAFDRPEVRNAFRPHTVDELYRVLDHARMTPDVGCVLLTGNGPSPKDGGWAFCSGGDQRIRGRAGYQYADGETADTVDPARGRPAAHPRGAAADPHHAQGGRSRSCPAGPPAAGTSLHVVCDLTIASREHARFKQTDADVGSFDGGYGSAYLARQVGQKFAREIFFLGRAYDAADDAPDGRGQRGRADHARARAGRAGVARGRSARKSPTAQRMLKFAFNLVDDGLVGPAGVRRRGDPAGVHDGRGGRGPGRVPGEARPDWSPFPYYY